MNCLWCDGELVVETSWYNLFIPPKQELLCLSCWGELQYLSGPRCQYCSKQTDDTVCSDCKQWKESELDFLHFNYSIFTYNDRMKEMVTKWKYRGDYELGHAFQQSFKQIFKKIFSHNKKYHIIPVPLSRERLKERGFNQAEMLASFITPAPLNPLVRVHGEKQSKRTRTERLNAKNPFEIKEQLNKPAILVDDIYTTGITLRHAAHILKQAGCPEVFGLTLIRG